MRKGRGLASVTFAITILVNSAMGARSDESPPELASKASVQVPADDKSPGEPTVPEGARDQAREQPTSETPEQKRASTFETELVEAARVHSLPADFFKRLIWQESRFKPYAVSRAGALGIAQFMPDTAQWRGLADPFNPSEALHESARWLRELWGQFGNLGLAAAAYNAGPGRVTRWLAGRSNLPAETRAYVKLITGEPAERWSGCADTASEHVCPAVASPPVAVPSGTGVSVAQFRRMPRPTHAVLAAHGVAISDIDAGPSGPWGLQLVGDWSQSRALSQFKRIQSRFGGVLGSRNPVILRGQLAGRGSATWYRVRVAESTRERAVDLCARLERAGGSCLVMRN